MARLAPKRVNLEKKSDESDEEGEERETHGGSRVALDEI